MTIYAAVMGVTHKDDVIGYVSVSDRKLKKIKIAGDFTTDGSPVNVTNHKISYALKNLKKADFAQPVFIHKSGVYAFEK